ncbi:MAG: hypothetical protein AB1430_16430 [Pseudomonadota bacterium]
MAIRIALASISLLLLPCFAHALQRGELEGGIPFATGGIGREEVQALHAERKRYTLWVATLAKGSGAYLSDARLRITRLDAQAPVLQATLDGPWFFAALPPGRYRVSASWGSDAIAVAQTLETQVQVRAGHLRQAVFRFVAEEEVRPERDSEFGGNPFGGQDRPR